MPENLRAQLFVRSSFNKYIMFSGLKENVEPFIVSDNISSFGKERKKKEMELKKTKNTLELIMYFKSQGITSFSIVNNGPYSLPELIDFNLLNEKGLELIYICDNRPIPHNGGRIPKKRRFI